MKVSTPVRSNGANGADVRLKRDGALRDVGGPRFALKRGLDMGLAPGPRIWPSGAFISQSGGHGDFRLPNELPARPGDHSFSERMGASFIADSPDAVRKRVREQLALGASQIKLMAGGGVSSSYDPLDVTQYSLAEVRAAVEAAENWGTYVTVHAYTPRAVRQAIEAGVRCIDHGQLLDDATVKLMAEKGTWWSLQPFLDDDDAIPFPDGSANRAKQLQMTSGTDTAYQLAKKYKIKTAWGLTRCSMPLWPRSKENNWPRWCAGTSRPRCFGWRLQPMRNCLRYPDRVSPTTASLALWRRVPWLTYS